MLIELFPPGLDGQPWGARVTGRGRRVEQAGFAIAGDAYSWAMRQWLAITDLEEVDG